MKTLRDSAGDTRGRGTAQRAAVLDVLAGTGRFRTAQDIFSELRARGDRIGLTTVYRHLQRLAEDGTIHTVQTADRQTAYRQCSGQPHHHLVCTECGDGIEIADAALNRSVESEAALRGFSAVTHSIEIFGICPSCALSPSSRRRGSAAG